jgi:hypothetical protein
MYSDLLKEIKKQNIEFEVVLANMPQTPFYKKNVKIDKNGGTDGIYLNE